AMTRLSPVLAVVGAETLFQPVWVDDVAQAAVMGVTGRAAPGTYELGGPEVKSFRGLMTLMLDVVRRRRMVVNLPFGLAAVMAKLFGIGQALSLGLVPAPITTDQVANLKV